MTDDEATAIRIAAAHYRHQGARDTDVRQQLDMSPTRFAQVVNALIDRPDVIAAYPLETARLRRLREKRAAVRNRQGSLANG